MRSDICIVGGGPAGLSAALALAQSGREVTVLDCATPPIDKPCGEGLMPDSMAALTGLGVTPPAGGMELRGIRFFDSSSCVCADFPSGLGLGVRRPVLHQALVARAQQLSVRLLWGVKNVHTRCGRVSYSGGDIDTNLIIGADGQQSCVRLEAGLHDVVNENRRYGFRKHYGAAPWSPYIEVYWGDGFQVYVTPVACDQVCVALISRDQHLRLEEALRQLPDLAAKLGSTAETTAEKGSLSVSRTFRRVWADGYALLGDASGSTDAITGEGMCLAFKQAAALVAALDARDMRLYQRNHERIRARPLQMAALMQLLDKSRTLQRKALAALAAHPEVFNAMLSAHIGYKPLAEVVSWRLLSFGVGVLCA